MGAWQVSLLLELDWLSSASLRVGLPTDSPVELAEETGRAHWRRKGGKGRRTRSRHGCLEL